MLQLGENQKLKDSAIYAGVVFIVTQTIAFASGWFGVIKMQGDIAFLSSDSGSVAIRMGFFNMKSFVSTAFFIGLVIMGGSMLIKKFKCYESLINWYNTPKKKMVVYSLVILVLIIIQVIIIKQYSYSGSGNILMGIIASKLSVLRDNFSDIFGMFDILDYLY